MVRKLEKTIKYGDMVVEITVREKVVMDRFVERGLYRRAFKAMTGREFKSDDVYSIEAQRLNEAIPMIVRTESINGLPFKWVTEQSSDEDLKSAMDHLIELPESVYDAWDVLLDTVNKPPGNPNTAPPETLTDEQKKALKS